MITDQDALRRKKTTKIFAQIIETDIKLLEC